MTDTLPDAPADAPEASPGFDLDDFEVRVLAVLIEKAFVTPDTYPLSVNSLVSGCNQLTGREPVMSLSEATVLATLDRLAERGLVSQRHQAGARVAKWEHQIRLRHSLTPPMQAVLAILMLRGAQTVGEIRAAAAVFSQRVTVTFGSCFKNSEHCSSACPCETTSRISDSFTPGSASRL